MDPLLQSSLAEGLTQEAVMNLGIRASGKLHLLDNILSEFKNQGRKVLILFQVHNVIVYVRKQGIVL